LKNRQDHKKGLGTRPDWDTFFLTSVFLVAQRSIDESTLHGAIVVSKDNRVLSQGYNGPISGSNDSLIPQERPEKYAHFLHAEENALLNYNGSSSDLENATVYVTGRPCSRCLRMMLQKGIRRIVHAKNDSKCVDETDMNSQRLMLEYLQDKVEIVEKENVTYSLIGLLNRTISHIVESTNYEPE